MPPSAPSQLPNNSSRDKLRRYTLNDPPPCPSSITFPRSSFRHVCEGSIGFLRRLCHFFLCRRNVHNFRLQSGKQLHRICGSQATRGTRQGGQGCANPSEAAHPIDDVHMMAAWHGEAKVRPWSSVNGRNYTGSSRQLAACSAHRGAAHKHAELPTPSFPRCRDAKRRSAGAKHISALKDPPLLLRMRSSTDYSR